MTIVETVVSSAQDIAIAVFGLVTSAAIGFYAGAKGWWRGKTKAQKKELIKDVVVAFRDGKLSSEEFESLVDEHL